MRNHLISPLEPVSGLLVQAAENHLVQRRWYGCPMSGHRVGIVSHVRSEHLLRVGTNEGWPAGQHLVVFCCSLLHLATPVTKGRRFGLFAFFYGEEEEALRQRINAELGTAAG